MQFAHSFWSKPLFENKFEKYFSFQECIKNTLLDYAYSVECVHKFGYKIKLYADKKAIELLSFIPYDEIIEISIPDDVPKHFAACSKFYAMQKMEIGDILIDGDTFLETKEVYDKIKTSKCDVIFAFNEINELILCEQKSKNPKEYYIKLLSKFNNTLYKLPKINEIEYPNTCFLQINNKTLKNEYIQQYFYHLNQYKEVDFEYTWPDLIVEQYFLGQLNKKYNALPLLDDYTKPKELPGFVHLGSGKTKFRNIVRQKLYFLNKEVLKNVLENIEKWTKK